MALPRIVMNESQKACGGLSRMGLMRSTNSLAGPWITSSGKFGNGLSSGFCDIKTSIVSMGLGLDCFFLLQNNNLAGFKLNCERTKKPFIAQLTYEDE
jgi:hypothetical protein